MGNQLHLSDEQFSDVLLGIESASVRAHLDGCPQCAAETARVSGAIGDFNYQSQVWADRHAASGASLAERKTSRSAWMQRPMWAAAALVLMLAVGAGVSVHRSHESTISSGAQSPTVGQVSPATLKADNELLSAIDGELQADETSPASAYRLGTAAHTEHSKAAKRPVAE